MLQFEQGRRGVLLTQVINIIWQYVQPSFSPSTLASDSLHEENNTEKHWASFVTFQHICYTLSFPNLLHQICSCFNNMSTTGAVFGIRFLLLRCFITGIQCFPVQENEIVWPTTTLFMWVALLFLITSRLFAHRQCLSRRVVLAAICPQLPSFWPAVILEALPRLIASKEAEIRWNVLFIRE